MLDHIVCLSVWLYYHYETISKKIINIYIKGEIYYNIIIKIIEINIWQKYISFFIEDENWLINYSKDLIIIRYRKSGC